MLLTNLLLSILASVPASAEIPRELYHADQCTIQRVAPTPDAGVAVVAGVRCHTLYADIQLIEVAFAPPKEAPEFYLYDRNETYEFERARRGYPVRYPTDIFSNDGGVLFLNTDAEGRAHYVMNVSSVGRAKPPAPVEIYVKAGGRQVEGRAIFLD